MKDHDKNKELSYLTYSDVNNSYGLAIINLMKIS